MANVSNSAEFNIFTKIVTKKVNITLRVSHVQLYFSATTIKDFL